MAFNGKKTSWQDIKVNLPHGVLIDVQDISFEDSRKVNKIMGAGSRVQGFSDGAYDAKGKLSMLIEEFDKLSAKAGTKGIYGIDPFPITINYRLPKDNVTKTVTLQSCKFTSRKSGSKSGDEMVSFELDFEVLEDILYDGATSFSDS